MASLNKPLGITSGADMLSTHSQTTVFGFRHPRSNLVCRNRGLRCAFDLIILRLSSYANHNRTERGPLHLTTLGV